MALPRPLRRKVAALIGSIDEYNSLVETADPGQRDKARLTKPLRDLLASVEKDGIEIGRGLVEVLKDEP